jgi:F-type H+-transporting ATPase subunit b
VAEPARALNEGTAAPGAPEHTGLPQMDPANYPSQIFWLVVTFGALFVVLSRVALPRIAGVIGERRHRIEGDLGEAENLRKAAADALQSYQTALAQARTRAHQMADENRKRINGEIDTMKRAADADAQNAMNAAEARIAEESARAGRHVRASAAEAAAAIVQRLIGEPVSAADAERAVASVADGA